MVNVLESFADVSLSPKDQAIYLKLDRTANAQLFNALMSIYGVRRNNNSQFVIPLSPVSASYLRMILGVANVHVHRNEAFEDLVRIGQWYMYPEYAKEAYSTTADGYYRQAMLGMQFHTAPWKHQIHAAFLASSYLEGGGGFGLWMDMGTGKSKAAIDVFSNIPLARLILIVCPKTVRDTWIYQLETHYRFGTDNVSLLNGGGEKNAQLLREGIQSAKPGKPIVFVVNYDAVWREPLGTAIRKQRWDMVIADEIHRIKSPGAKVSRYFALLRNSAIRRLGLSGTPMTQSPLDAYAIYRFLDPQVFNCNYLEFKDKYAIQANMGTFKKVVGFRNLDDMAGKIGSISIRYESDEVLDLPETMDEIRLVEMGNLRHYKEMEVQFCTDVQEHTITATTGAARLLKLMQIASGFVYDEFREQLILDQQHKINALVEMIEEMPAKESAVVFCTFTAEIENIAASLESELKITPYLLYQGQNDLREFQRGEPSGNMEKVPDKKILVAQIESGKEGIDLTMARYCFYFSHPLKLASYLQSRKRIHRPGQTRTCFYYHLMTKGTVETRIYKALQDKRDVIEALLEEAKAYKGDRK